MTSTAPFRIALTVDVHEEDQPENIGRAAHWLHAEGIPATFFVPSALFNQPDFGAQVAALPRMKHEVGSHGHRHDFAEIQALMYGGANDLGFLQHSQALYGDTFGCAPVSFRSPAWCPLSTAARSRLVTLGYRVDSSATPQRLPIFSSTPYADTWLWARRDLHELAPGLLEAPTSCLLLPAAAPTFLTLRRKAGLAFLRLLLWEARHFAGRVPCLQFHVHDFAPDAAAPRVEERLNLGSFWPRRNGGLRFKVFLRERDPGRVFCIMQAVIETLRREHGARFVRLRDLLDAAT